MLAAGGPESDALFARPADLRAGRPSTRRRTQPDAAGTVLFGTPVGGVVAFQPNQQQSTWIVFRVTDRRTDDPFDPAAVAAISRTQIDRRSGSGWCSRAGRGAGHPGQPALRRVGPDPAAGGRRRPGDRRDPHARPHGLRRVPHTVVVLPARWTGVLPAAAVPALRAATHVYADATVPDEVLAATGATPLDGGCRPAPGPCCSPPTPGTRGRPARRSSRRRNPPGAALLDAVAVMDRLRSPGGCPWDAEQTHESLLQYLVEECYELYQAIEDGDRAAMREELGDVLLQVLFHARVAAEGRRVVRRRRRGRRPRRQARRPAPARVRAVRCRHESGSTPRSARSTAGRSSSAPRSSASPAWTVCRSGSPRWRWPPS